MNKRSLYVIVAVIISSILLTTAMSLSDEELPTEWAQADVSKAVSLKLVPDNLKSKYTQATTRAEFCALAVALYETVMEKSITERVLFNDTNDVNVQKMGALEVVNGVGDGDFAPDNPLTRQEAATMLARLAVAIGKPLEKKEATFYDNGEIAEWAIIAVGQMQASGVMGGTGNNRFQPEDPYTREQSIVTILRMYNIMSIKAGANPVVTITMENGKTIVMELYPDKAPNTVNNFISLINKKFYDGLSFHRVAKGFMIQGGCPAGNGTGGPGYSIKGEFASNGFTGNDLSHRPGVVSMARTTVPDSAGSQFFICSGNAASLDGDYAAFGLVTSGMEEVYEIAELNTAPNGGPPSTPQVIKTITVDTFGVTYPEPEKIN